MNTWDFFILCGLFILLGIIIPLIMLLLKYRSYIRRGLIIR